MNEEDLIDDADATVPQTAGEMRAEVLGKVDEDDSEYVGEAGAGSILEDNATEQTGPE